MNARYLFLKRKKIQSLVATELNLLDRLKFYGSMLQRAEETLPEAVNVDSHAASTIFKQALTRFIWMKFTVMEPHGLMQNLMRNSFEHWILSEVLVGK